MFGKASRAPSHLPGLSAPIRIAYSSFHRFCDMTIRLALSLQHSNAFVKFPPFVLDNKFFPVPGTRTYGCA
jgi:hypothetical protein